jgi:hypothetical protein
MAVRAISGSSDRNHRPIRPSAIRLPPYVTIAIVDRTKSTVCQPVLCRLAEMGDTTDRLREREPVMRVK